MYVITVKNGSHSAVIHDRDPESLQKLPAAAFTEEVNAVANMQFTICPQNAGYSFLKPMSTYIEVYNTVTGKVDFEGRLLDSTGIMQKNGQITQKWSAEGLLGFLMDSVQDYRSYKNTDVPEFLESVLAFHNSITEESKHIFLGECDIHDTSGKTTAYRKTLEEIRENLISRLGGEIRIRRHTDGRLYLDYMKKLGKNSTARITLGRNLQEMEAASDPTGIITRLIPLGAQLNDDTAERLTIASVHGGCIYLDDPDALAALGTQQCAVQIWEDVTEPENLKKKAQTFLHQNNAVRHRYKLTAIDLSLIGLDIESFSLWNSYLTENRLMGISEWLRLIKRNVNIIEPLKSTMEFGDTTEPLTAQSNRTYSYITGQLPKMEMAVLSKAQNKASRLIREATSGKIVMDNTAGELLIMTGTDKAASGTRIWKFSAAGWQESIGGYEGPFRTIASMGSGMTADFLQGGTLTDIPVSVTSPETGKQSCLQAEGLWVFHDRTDHTGQRCTVTSEGLSVYGKDGSLYTSIADGTLKTAAVSYLEGGKWTDLAETIREIKERLEALGG